MSVVSDSHPQDWLIRVGDAQHFHGSSHLQIWGINSTTDSSKGFIRRVRPGDRLWMVQSKMKGKLVSVVTFTEIKSREIGPLIDITRTNKEFGWDKTKDGNWDSEIHYTDHFGISNLDLRSHILGAATMRLYNEKCKVNLPEEYLTIIKYSQVQRL